MDVRKRVIFWPLITLAGLICFLLSTVHHYQNSQRNIRSIHHHNQAYGELQDIQSALQDMSSGSLGFVVSHNYGQAQAYERASLIVDRSLLDTRSLLSADSIQRSKLDSLNSLILELLNFDNLIMSHATVTGGPSDSLVRTGIGVSLLDQARNQIRAMRNREFQAADRDRSEYRASSQKFLINTLVAGGAAFLLLLFGIYRTNLMYIRFQRIGEDLRSSETKYRKLIEDSGVVMFTSDYKGDFTNVSQRVFDLTGYTSTELLGKSFALLVAPDWVERVTRHYLEQFEQQIPESTLEFPIHIKEGKQKWIRQLGVTLFENGKPKGLQCIVRDITADKELQMRLKKSEEQLRENESLLQAIMENSTAMIFIKDLQSRYLFANRQFKETFRVNDETLYGKTDYDLEPAELAKRYHAVDELIFQGSHYQETEEIIVLHGEPHNYLVVKFPLLDSKHELFGLCGIATDITDRSRYQSELIEARKKAEMAEKLQEQFLATMSHEIRTPINGIVGMTNLLSSTSLNKNQQEFLQTIRESSDILLMLINDILDVSKIKAGMLNLEKIPFELREILQTMQYAFAYRFSEKGLEFRMDIDPSLPPILVGDPHRLKQILNNLIGNALKFTQSGEVRLKVSLSSTTGDQARIQFRVSDTGIGIPTDKLDSIFESFKQVGSDISRRYGGTGLGLTITKQLVELQQGSIQVSSVPGKGTSFLVTIPFGYRDTALPGERLEFRQNIRHDLNGLNILVAEDNAINQKVVFYTLQKVGARPVIVNNGKEAVEALKGENSFDLVLMDIQMPELDGYSASRKIREDLGLKIPIIAMTATALKGEKEKCLQAGMNGYISKPFAPADLFEQITRLLQSRQTETPKPMESKPVAASYDLSYLVELEDDEYLLEVLNLFLDSTPPVLSEIRQSIGTGDWEQVYHLNHRLKSSLGMFQMQAILDLVTQMEQNAKNRTELDRMDSLISQALEAYQHTLPSLEMERDKVKNRISGK